MDLVIRNKKGMQYLGSETCICVGREQDGRITLTFISK